MLRLVWVLGVLNLFLGLFLSEKAFAAELDLRSWNKAESLSLKGPWEFYPNALLEPSSPLPQTPPLLTEIGQTWNDLEKSDGSKMGSHGFATYRLVLKNLSPQPDSYQIFLPPAGTAFRAFAFPLKGPGAVSESRSGWVSSDPQKERGSKHWGELRIHPTETGDYVVLIQVSNFHQIKGGYWALPYLATGQKASRIELLSTLETVFSMGILAGLGLYSFLIWYRHREQKASQYLALGALAALIRMWSTTDTLAVVLPENAYALLNRLEYASMPAGVFFFFAVLFHSFAELRFPKWVFPCMAFLGGILVLIPFLSSQNLYTQLLVFYQLYILLSLLLEALLIGAAIRRRLSGIGPTFIGVLVVFGALIFDILVARSIIQSSLYLSSLSIALFLLLQAEAVAERAAQAYDRVNKLTIELKEKERARTLFFHNTSHELRTPLNGIIGFLELMSKGHFGSITQTLADPIHKTLRLAESLKHQVNTILDLAKAKRGELDLQTQHFSLKELKRDADLLAEGLSLKSQKLSYSSQLQAQNLDFIGDKEKIFTILRNLLGNAFKFRDPQRLNQVELKINFENNRLTLLVTDTGIGIPKDFQSKIFEEFTQVQGDARRAYEGTGLGLAMVRDLTRVMGGQIELQSELGKGTQIRIEIPKSELSQLSSSPQITPDLRIGEIALQAQSSSGPISKNSEPMSAHTPSPQGEGSEIYIIDDNEINCEVMEGMLKLEGYKVRHAVSGRIGLEELRQRRCDLLLLDMMMPEISGEDVMRAMKQEPLLQEIPIILITARASEEDRISGLRLGADDYLAKPIVSAELKLRVRNMLERHRLIKEIEEAGPSDKLVHLGEMFSELSHELKNILNAGATLQDLKRSDIILSLAVLPLTDPELREATADALLAPELTENFNEHLAKLPELSLPPDYARTLKFSLCSLALTQSQRLSLWQALPQFSEDELAYFQSQLQLFSQYKQSLQTLQNSRDLTQTVLAYTRPDESHTSLPAVWQQTQTLLRGKLRKRNLSWQIELGSEPLAMSQSRLTQVMINLVQNALDAIEELPPSSQWIHIISQSSDKELILRISNAGPPIAEEIQKKLFQRGMTTKGQKGSGIGLFVSKRYMKEAGGDLIYDEKADHPCFILKIQSPEN